MCRMMITQGIQGFKQVQASVRRKTICLVFGGKVGFTRKDQVGSNLTRLGLYLYMPNLQDLSI
jgi:hypothetical protein